MNLGASELLIILGILLLLFGAKRLPETARSLGRSVRILRAEARGGREEHEAGEPGKSSARGASELSGGGLGSQQEGREQVERTALSETERGELERLRERERER